MRELKKWLARLISRLMPTQTSSGAGAIQIGKMGGGVTNVHLTQHIYYPPETHRADVPPIRVARPDRRVRPRPPHKEVQRQVLALLDQVPDRIAVLDFMAREFGTRMVIELDGRQLYRLRRYVEVILKNEGQP